MVQNRIVRLSPLPSLSEYPRGDVKVDAGQETSHQMPDNGSRETRNVRCRGRGRGERKIDQSAGLNIYSSVCGYGSRAERQPSALQSLPGHVVRMSSYAEGRLNQEPTPASLYGNGRQLPSGQVKSSPTEPSTLSMDTTVQEPFQAAKRRRTEVPSSICESVFQGNQCFILLLGLSEIEALSKVLGMALILLEYRACLRTPPRRTCLLN